MTLLVDAHRDYRRWNYTPSEKIQLANAGLQWVRSSNVSAVGIQDNDLIIRFHNGSMYRYDNQADKYKSIMASNSKGHWVWVNLRRKRVSYQKIGLLQFKGDQQVTDEEVFALVNQEGLDVETKLKALGLFIPNVVNNPLDLVETIIA